MIAAWGRAGIVLIIIVAHVALLILLSFRQRRESAEAPAMQLVLVPEQVSPAATPSPSRAQRARPTASDPNAAVASIDESQSSKPAIDWRASASAAASDAVARQLQAESYRNFGPPHRDPVEPTTPSIFKGPKHKAGDIDDDQRNGVTRVYHSERCFTQLDFPTLKDPMDELQPKINLPRCTRSLGTPEADGDLFKHLKKELPPPDLKPGTQPGPLPERIDPPQSP